MRDFAPSFYERLVPKSVAIGWEIKRGELGKCIDCGIISFPKMGDWGHVGPSDTHTHTPYLLFCPKPLTKIIFSLFTEPPFHVRYEGLVGLGQL